MNIEPLHEATDKAHVEEIAKNMRENGWVGRPILAVDCGDYLQAITGVHRIAAAKQEEIEIEVHIIEDPYTDDADEIELFCELFKGGDDDRVRVINELYEKDLVDLSAKELMEAEERENHEDLSGM